jgi:3-oxoacyl-[acyl-carrier protein] reductase
MVITGTSRGIGKALAEYYLDKGFAVAGCSRGESSIRNDDYFHRSMDVADPDAVYAFVSDVRSRFGKIDYLVNNAGITSMGLLVSSSAKSASEAMNVNFLGSFLFMKEAAKAMLPQRSGRIINLTTVAVPLEIEGESIYASSKAAIEEMTRISAKELSNYGITVNAIGPAPVETDMMATFPAEKIQALLAKQAVKRFCTIEDIANVVDFFIDDRSSFVTGQVLYLGGA